MRKILTATVLICGIAIATPAAGLPGLYLILHICAHCDAIGCSQAHLETHDDCVLDAGHTGTTCTHQTYLNDRIKIDNRTAKNCLGGFAIAAAKCSVGRFAYVQARRSGLSNPLVFATAGGGANIYDGNVLSDPGTRCSCDETPWGSGCTGHASAATLDSCLPR